MAKAIMLDDRIVFECPACQCLHGVNSGWEWNKSLDQPTFHPSILVRSTELTELGWRQHVSGPPYPERLDSHDTVCHSYVTNGHIQFLGDCTHPLAGRTVELPDM